MPVPIPRISWIFWILAAIFAVAAYSYFPWWTVDDAYISYRYGRNLFQWGELTWNVGEQRVEGYTGIFLPLLSGLLWRLGLPMIDAIKVLGILAILATGVLTEDTLRRLQVEPWRRGLVILLLAASPLIYLHSVSGLETVFFMVFISGAFWSLAGLQTVFEQGRSALPLALSLLLAGLCRPEGIALAGIAIVHIILLKEWFNPFAYKRFSILLTLGVIFPLVGYWCWRMAYYDALLPNSYHAKVFHGWVNVDSLIAWAKFGGYYLALPLLASLLMCGWPRRAGLRPERLLARTWITFSIVCVATYFHSHLWMNYGSRFFVPFLPMGLVTCAYLSMPRTNGHAVNEQLPRPKLILLGLLLLGQMGIMAFRFKQEGAFLNYYDAIVQDELVPVGKDLKARLPQGSRVISFMDAGALGYYSELPIVDFGRLNDIYLAQNQLDNTQILDYFFGINAAAVVMSSDSAHQISYIDEAMQIVADPRYKAYERISVWGNHVDYPYWQHVFLHKKP